MYYSDIVYFISYSIADIYGVYFILYSFADIHVPPYCPYIAAQMWRRFVTPRGRVPLFQRNPIVRPRVASPRIIWMSRMTIL